MEYAGFSATVNAHVDEPYYRSYEFELNGSGTKHRLASNDANESADNVRSRYDYFVEYGKW